MLGEGYTAMSYHGCIVKLQSSAICLDCKIFRKGAVVCVCVRTVAYTIPDPWLEPLGTIIM